MFTSLLFTVQDYECNGYFEEIVPSFDNKDRSKTVSISVVPTLPKVRLECRIGKGVPYGVKYCNLVFETVWLTTTVA